MNIERIQFWRLSLPLIKPYALSFGVLNEFDTILLKVESNNGIGWGEITLLPGYHRDSADDIQVYLKKASEKCLGLNVEEAADLVSEGVKKGCFQTTPLMMAFEEVLNPIQQEHGLFGEIPLIGLLNLDSDHESQLRDLLNKGCKAIKIKIGTDVAGELRQLRSLTSVSEIKKFEIRLDANQGLRLNEAYQFSEVIQDLPVIYLEQPFGMDDWKSTAEFTKTQHVAVMLDEPIYDKNDVEKARESGASWIKLKIAKQGSRARMLELIQLAEGLGLKVIMGNGVATEIACLAEAMVWLQSSQQHDGEMNGFRKMKASLSENQFQVKGYRWHLLKPETLKIHEETICQQAIWSHELKSNKKLFT